MTLYGINGAADDMTININTAASSLSAYRGSAALDVGQEGGSVAVALPFVPTQVRVSVRKPAGGLGITANVTGTPSITGFDYELSGSPEVTGYYLDYEVAG